MSKKWRPFKLEATPGGDCFQPKWTPLSFRCSDTTRHWAIRCKPFSCASDRASLVRYISNPCASFHFHATTMSCRICPDRRRCKLHHLGAWRTGGCDGLVRGGVWFAGEFAALNPWVWQCGGRRFDCWRTVSGHFRSLTFPRSGRSKYPGTEFQRLKSPVCAAFCAGPVD